MYNKTTRDLDTTVSCVMDEICGCFKTLEADRSSSEISVCSSRRLLAQDDVGDAGDEGEAEGDPGQDEGGSVPARVLFMEDVCVDGGRDHDAQT